MTETADQTYHRVDSLAWTNKKLDAGKRVHLKTLPNGHQMKFCRVGLSTQRTEYVVTNDHAQDSADATRQESAIR